MNTSKLATPSKITKINYPGILASNVPDFVNHVYVVQVNYSEDISFYTRHTKIVSKHLFQPVAVFIVRPKPVSPLQTTEL